MKIDPGLAVVFAAVSIFYVRLIILQREKARRAAIAQAKLVKKKNGKAPRQESASGESILSQSLVDRLIAGAGILAIVAGVLLYTQAIPLPGAQPYWWLATAAGIIAFNWAFKL